MLLCPLVALLPQPPAENDEGDAQASADDGATQGRASLTPDASAMLSSVLIELLSRDNVCDSEAARMPIREEEAIFISLKADICPHCLTHN